jgi:outer membrane protein assembly factor BamE (lipoprotein component of BamABCDE complex)
MTIKTACPSCRRAYGLADSQESKRVRCKDCGESFVVRAAPEVEGGAAEEEDGREGLSPPGPRKGRRVLLFALLGGALLLLAGGGVAAVLLLLRGPRGNQATPENFAKLKSGMSESEVHSILGPPTEIDDSARRAVGGNLPREMFAETHVWRNGNYAIKALMNGGHASRVWAEDKPPSEKVTEEDFKKLALKMPERRVLELLGPPSDEATSSLGGHGQSGSRPGRPAKTVIWANGLNKIVVYFDGRHEVMRATARLGDKELSLDPPG